MANENTMFDFFELDDVLDTYEQDEEKAQGWSIQNDSAADWAVRKIHAEREELERLEKIARAEVDRIAETIAAARLRYKGRTAFLTSKLREYFGHVPHKETKTTEKYQLLSGALVYTKPAKTYDKDDAALLAFLKESGRTEFIKTTEAPAWGEYKKRLEIVGDHAVDTETGEIVECVRVVEKPEAFDVK